MEALSGPKPPSRVGSGHTGGSPKAALQGLTLSQLINQPPPFAAMVQLVAITKATTEGIVVMAL
ncbi:hypothetical protein PGT21_023579 [Puccinia graminis f. sp. tritici]|uniref:Uncharacterized protein n=1 Tax=Puccinia graminis f. sp. tritici TaxID=56615 RepID=A0A5B0N768_PUCGR|nr:hypothetical protein PGT21_000663 [Puccinia graminis f. sp. tritici]KAA1084294.1 hypothetical protein PGT21_023579 [Puccinia graminis f. sp. tritici]KAA1092315.1 hypothetical protein PGTUg99_018811 [Puccinia graminis f. sp. tritici]